MQKFILNLLKDLQLYQYLIVGGIAAMTDLALFLLFRHYLPWHYLAIATLSFFGATLVNYVLCNRFVFNQQHHFNPQTRLMLTYLVSGVGLIIHHSCLFCAIEFGQLPILLSKLLAMATAFGWNFLSRKHFVFAHAQSHSM